MLKALQLAKMTRKLSLKGAWGELDSGRAFPGTVARGVSYTGPGFRVGWRGAGAGGVNFYFSGVFFWYWLVALQLVRQLVYIILISNNCTSFYLW